MDSKKIGAAIKKLRVAAGYTQHDLASSLDVTDKAVSKWERGLGIPDIATIPRLSLCLGVDMDNLLEGDAAFLGNAWSGILLLPPSSHGLSPDRDVCGRSLIDRVFMYFLLASIRRVFVVADEETLDRARAILGTGRRYGVFVSYESDPSKAVCGVRHAMVIKGYPLLYGANVTRYFQRAFKKERGLVVLGAPYPAKNDSDQLYAEGLRVVGRSSSSTLTFVETPFFVCGEGFAACALDESMRESAIGDGLYFVEPLGYGTIYRDISTEDDVRRVAEFIAFVEEATGVPYGDLDEIARRRKLVSPEHVRE